MAIEFGGNPLGKLIQVGLGAACLYLAPMDLSAQETGTQVQSQPTHQGFPSVVEQDLLRIGQRVVDGRKDQLCGVEFPTGIDVGFKAITMNDPAIIQVIGDCKARLSKVDASVITPLYEYMEKGCFFEGYHSWCGDKERFMSGLSEISQRRGGLLGFKMGYHDNYGSSCLQDVAFDLVSSTIATYEGVSLIGHNPTQEAYNRYYKKMLFESTKKELQTAKSKMLAQKKSGGKINPYYEWRIDTFISKDLEHIFDQLPFVTQERRGNIYRRLLKNLELQSVDIVDQDEENAIGAAYSEENRYEVDPDIKSYPEFKHVHIHELLHVMLQGGSEDPFYLNLCEGITEYLTHKLGKLCGISLGEVSYPGVYHFAEQLSQLKEGAMIDFYTGEGMINFPDSALAKYSQYGGVVFDTKEKKNLGLAIHTRLATGMTCGMEKSKRDEAIKEIALFMRDLFNTTFDIDTEADEMSDHYEELANRLADLMAKYGDVPQGK